MNIEFLSLGMRPARLSVDIGTHLLGAVSRMSLCAPKFGMLTCTKSRPVKHYIIKKHHRRIPVYFGPSYKYFQIVKMFENQYISKEF